MHSLPLLPLVLALGACGSNATRGAFTNASEVSESEPSSAASNDTSAPQHTGSVGKAPEWALQPGSENSLLVLAQRSKAPLISLSCPGGGGKLVVTVPGFRSIASEERLSFGSGGTVVVLVAGTRRDAGRGGVSGSGPVPAELATLIAGRVSASYGAQVSGPHPAPPGDLARAFAAACTAPPPPAGNTDAPGTPCNTQAGTKIAVPPLQAVGTEPFWNVQIEGRCVTYSDPEHQQGTRIWTRYTPGAGGGGTWAGAYAGKPFELRLRSAPGCSDGMSDRRYPLAAKLAVAGGTRSGCAGPRSSRP